jgi:hypothetical protein
VGQDGPGSPQAAEFPAAGDDLVPGGRQVGGQDYGFENGGTLFKLTAFGSQPRPGAGSPLRAGAFMEKLKQAGGKSKYSHEPGEFLLKNYNDIGIFTVL